MRGPRRHERGAASVEHVALVALVAVALSATTAVAAPEMGRDVVAHLRHALCRAAGASCPPPEVAVALGPCTVRSQERVRRAGVSVVVLRLRGGRRVRLEERSDGTARVLVGGDGRAGLGVGLGASVQVAGARVGLDARGEAVVGFGSGVVHEFPTRRAAERFVERLRASHHDEPGPVGTVRRWLGRDEPPAPRGRPAERYVEGGGDGSVALSATALRLLGADARTTLAGAIGRREVVAGPRRGQVTWYLRMEDDTAAGAGGPEDRASRGLAGRVAGLVELTVDAQGDPVELRLRDQALVDLDRFRAQLRARPPRALRRGPAAQGPLRRVLTGPRRPRPRQTPGGSGARDRTALRGLEAEGRLDLRDPANARYARLALSAVSLPSMASPVGGPVAAPFALLAVARRMEEAGTVQLRFVRRRRAASTQGGELAAGGRLGGELETTEIEEEVTAEWVRLPDGRTVRRTDCFGVA